MSGRPAIDRIIAAVVIDEDTGCWRCTIGIQANGYSHVQVAPGRFELSHRVAYETFVSAIPGGFTLDHVQERGCRHKNCVNLDHLEPVTLAENIRRSGAPSSVAARTNRCSKGHRDWIPNGKGRRTCGTCLRERRAAA